MAGRVIILFVLVTSAAAAAGGKVYVCPMAEHPREYGKPGFCPLDGMELVDKGARLRIAVLVHENVEEIDYAAPWEVFGWSGATLFTVGPTTAAVHSAFGLKIVPDYDLEHAPEADMLLIPGGGIPVVVKDERLLNWIRQRAATAKYVMSVCNAAFILARAGLLDGLDATTTADQLARLAALAPKTHVVAERVVDNGKIITTGGLSSGIDGALHVVERQSGLLKAQEIARDIEYQWDPQERWTRAKLADLRMPHVIPADVSSWEVLSDKGDTATWETRGRVGTEKSIDEFLGEAAKKATAAGWTLTGQSANRRDFQTTAGEARWKFSIQLAPDAAAKTYIATMEIVRAG